MALNPGTRLDSYEILAPLGAGGMGEVYRARDTKLDRDVAVKVLPEHLAADPQALARFEREAKAVAALSHPNILAIHDFAKAGDQVYAVIELLEGETLGERMGQGPLPVRQATSIGRDIAEGLAAAHDAGIVHRDLKPDNVFLLNDGRVKILDFGLAKQTTGPVAGGLSQTAAIGARAQTDPGTVLGTVGYMSPEQIRGADVDYRTDIFSFGIVLYEMLCGERPFHGDTSVETMTAILREDPPELTASVPGLPPALDSVVRRCLEKRPESRFQSARDLGFALVTSGRTSSLSSAAIETPPAPRSRRWLIPVLCLVAGAVIGAAAGTLRKPETVTVMPRLHPITFSGGDGQPAASPDGKLVAFVSDRDGSVRVWIKQIASGGEAPLTEGPDGSPRFSPDGSQILFTRDEGDSAAVYRQGLVGGQARKMIANAYQAAWSPDGSRVAFLRAQGNSGGGCFLGITDGGGGSEKIVWEWGPYLGRGLAWSPDGSRVGCTGTSVTGNQCAFRITDVENGAVQEIDLGGNPLCDADWSASGELIMAQSTNPLGSLSDPTVEVFAYDPKSGTRRTLFWDRDLLLAIGGYAGALSILSPGVLVLDHNAVTAGLTLEKIAPGPDPDPVTLTRGLSIDRQPAFSPDGRYVVFSSNRSGQLDLWVLDTLTGVTNQLTDDPALDWDPGFTPDGDHVLWSSNRGGHLEIWMAQRDGSNARQVSHDGVDAENPTMTPGGEWVVYGSSNGDKTGIWRVHPDGTGAAQIAAGSLTVPDVSPDGRYALGVRLNPEATLVRVEVHDIARAEPVPFAIELPFDIRVNVVVIGRGRWMPDGNAIAFVGTDEHHYTGIFVQDFVPGKDTRASRRALSGFSGEYDNESFDISPDGKTLVVSRVQQMRSLMLAEGLPGVKPIAQR